MFPHGSDDFLKCHQAKEVIKANNLSGTVIVLHGRVEVGHLLKFTLILKKHANASHWD